MTKKTSGSSKAICWAVLDCVLSLLSVPKKVEKLEVLKLGENDFSLLAKQKSFHAESTANIREEADKAA